MATPITTDVLRDYLSCTYKAHLRFAGKQGVRSDYEIARAEAGSVLRVKAIHHILASYPASEVERNTVLTRPALGRGASFILDAELQDGHFRVHFDGLKRVDGRSELGDFQYLPVLFHGGGRVRKAQRLLLAALGYLLGRLQGKSPDRGLIYHGGECMATTVHFGSDLKAAEDMLERVGRVQRGEAAPKLLLNGHCQVCEFRRQCHAQAVGEDNLSLLRGLSEKEVKGYGRKGLFTLTQLAHTFRPRRKGKRSDRRHQHRYHALQALAIRDRRVYVLGAPQVPDSEVRIYLDLEGDPEEGLIYLIGMIVCDGREGGGESRYSFWADGKDHERDIFEQFLEVVSRYEDPRVYCYGNYERAFIRRMRRVARRKTSVDKVLGRLVNTLSIIYAHLYFPTYSNGLKEVAGCLGFSWSETEASGVQSIAWRMRWERTRGDQWKEKLIRYNLEDCEALRRVTEFIRVVSVAPSAAGEAAPVPAPASEGGPIVARVEELDQLGAVNRRGKIQFFHKDYQYINDCAHFDYQRQRVYVRTSKLLRKNARRPRRCRPQQVLRQRTRRRSGRSYSEPQSRGFQGRLT